MNAKSPSRHGNVVLCLAHAHVPELGFFYAHKYLLLTAGPFLPTFVLTAFLLLPPSLAYSRHININLDCHCPLSLPFTRTAI